MSCRYLRNFINMAAEHLEGGVPSLLNEALDCFDEIGLRPDMRAEFFLEPGGDGVHEQLLRAACEDRALDHDLPEQRRHILRLWLDVSELRPIAPEIDLPGDGGIKKAATPARPMATG